MKDSKASFRSVLKNLGSKHLLAIIVSIVLSIVAIAYIGNTLYASARSELKLQGEMEVIQSSDRFSSYLLVDKNALIIASYAVNNLLINRASTEEILEYMTDQSERMINAIDENFTGLYGWINKEYLDGSGWVPDSDYIATERPWYKAAFEQPYEIVFVDPYVDKQTGEVTMTLAQLLVDGRSVIALDLGLEGAQAITNEIAANSPGTTVMVLDNSNVAIAHSDVSEVGNNYSEMTDTLGGLIVQEMEENPENNFTVSYDGKTYQVFTKEIEGGWHCVSVIDQDTFYKPLLRVTLLTVALGILAVVLVLLIFYRLSLRDLNSQNLHIQIRAAADIYGDLVDINLKNNTYYELNNRGVDKLEPTLLRKDAQKALHDKMEELAADSVKEFMTEFLDLSTVSERMGEKNTMIVEFLNCANKWVRGRFICAERNSRGEVIRVLWGTELIDEEKRQREHFRQLAETDLMTGILNRVTGEYRVTELLSSGIGGMFVLFDIDKFKQFNDLYGHNVGDQVIITVANCLKSAFRGDDIVMRLGGDEFVAFAHSVYTREDGERILERFYDYLNNSVIKEADDETVCVSAGVTFCPEDGKTSFKELYEASDKCMYESKKVAGNRITYGES